MSQSHVVSLNFYDAALRHLGDANYLFADQRFANADQLYGQSAECALKAVMLALGMVMQDGKPQERKHAVHIDKLWSEFITFANGRNGTHYASAFLSNPFMDWSINQRYVKGSDILLGVVEAHQAGAEQAHSCLSQAILDGVVR